MEVIFNINRYEASAKLALPKTDAVHLLVAKPTCVLGGAVGQIQSP